MPTFCDQVILGVFGKRSWGVDMTLMSSRTWQRICILLCQSLFVLVSGHSAVANQQQQPTIVVAKISGPIGVGAGFYLDEVFEAAVKVRAALIILRLDTPGGLVTVTREIIRKILNSQTPVAVFVSPQGARAASAGTYMAYAAHIVAMAPGTHLGAATPIAMRMPGLPGQPQRAPPSNDEQDKSPPAVGSAERKMINDAIAYLRSLAQLRGRSEGWAEKFVKEAATLTSREAKKEGVIEIIADDVDDLLRQLDGTEVKISGINRKLNLKRAVTVIATPSLKAQFLAVITDPNIAFILLLIGVYGIIFEFWSPGLAGPGIVGGISLIVALMALSALPVSAAGLALLILGMVLMIAEAVAPGFGILGIGGVIAFIAGAIFLYDPAGADMNIAVAWPVIIATLITSLGILIGVVGMVVRSRRRRVVTGAEELLGLKGRVVRWNDSEGKVHVHGEIWAARSNRTLQVGDEVEVRRRDGLTLVVE